MPTITDANVELLGFSELLDYAVEQTGMPTASVLQAINAESRQRFYNTSLTYSEAQSEALVNFLKNEGFDVQYNGNQQWVGSAFQNSVQVEMPSIANSNNGTIYRGNLRQMYGNVKEFDGTNYFMQMSKYPVSGSIGNKALYVLGSIGSAAAAVSTGVWLGKTIDSALYNANPAYWDSIGLSQLNPALWNGCVNSDDSPFAGLFNFILGLDPDTGTAQMYLNQDTLAYLAYGLGRNGWFTSTDYYPPAQTSGELTITSLGDPYSMLITAFNASGWNWTINSSVESAIRSFINSHQDKRFCVSVGMFNGSSYGGWGTQLWAFNSQIIGSTITLGTGITGARLELYSTGTSSGYRNYTNSRSNSSAGMTAGYNVAGVVIDQNIRFVLTSNVNVVPAVDVPGVGNQPSATLPDITDWTDVPSTLDSLQQQYPSAFANPLVWADDDPMSNTSGNTSTWIPVPFPQITSATDTQPVSGTQTQTSVEVSQLPQELLDLLVKIVQQTETQTETETENQVPPENPTDTGTGSSPIPVAPTGSASALWSVYHPTQAQVDAFGGWLWSTSFVDQLIKVFENPMDAIISLHKVFVTPVDAGTTTIHAGHLDSEVPSAYVTQQYVYVDCGYVNCDEQFGNVFDYVGTSISLYLPFIGIVPLNVDEVMRSVIHIKYGCDLFTGAILAQVEIRRDGHNAVLYQYGGDGAVMYPVSGSRSSSFLTGLMATLGAAASVAVSGGASIPVMAAGVGGAIASAQKQVQHSGGFSGNSGAMGCKVPYLIIERPQTKIASLFPRLEGYPTNYSVVLGNCQNHVVCSSVHVHGMTATQPELEMIEEFLRSGVEI